MGLISEFESVSWKRNEHILGLDEAGRGPMAGPLVVCGVILPFGYQNPGINDSKKLSDKARRLVFNDILDNAIYYDVIWVTAKEIDALNIYRATQKAMEDIIVCVPENIRVLTDAMPVSMKHESLIKGDARSLSIAAASIIAKVLRDDYMIELGQRFPEYGFEKHKGYGTKFHKEAMLKFGRTPEHRDSFQFKEGR